MARNVRFKVDVAGVRAVLRSSGVKQALYAKVEPIAARANAMAQEGRRLDADLYGAYVTEGSYTAFGHVATRKTGVVGRLARLDQARHKTLNRAGW